MKIYDNCYKVVKKKCFQFIKSQETSKEKFKNKEIMIKKYLITNFSSIKFKKNSNLVFENEYLKRLFNNENLRNRY